MEDLKLKKLIADSIEEIAAREREEQSRASQVMAEFDELMKFATSQVIARLKDLPSALAPYCTAAQGPGGWEMADNVKLLQKGWLPEYFVINAPGLVAISFRTDNGGFRSNVCSISFNGLCGTTGSWSYAITQAARRYQELKEDKEREDSFRAAEFHASERRPTSAERLADLIREIAQEGEAA